MGTSQKLQVANLSQIFVAPAKIINFFIPSHLCEVFGRKVFHVSFVFFFAVAALVLFFSDRRDSL